MTFAFAINQPRENRGLELAPSSKDLVGEPALEVTQNDRNRANIDLGLNEEMCVLGHEYPCKKPKRALFAAICEMLAKSVLDAIVREQR